MKINPATIQYNEQGTPIATDFDDVYFSNQNGLQESEFVFIKNNHLTERWTESSSPNYCILETGFGTGLNFLLTWKKFAELSSKPENLQLHFISIEKFPLNLQDLQQALKAWPSLENYAQELIAQYPPLTPGCHRLTFASGRVVLDLYLGDVASVLPNIFSPPEGRIDSFFLDGFAPSKNPAMWSETLFQQMARLGKVDASFATFTAAGFVRRGLIKVGFDVKKVPGFGRKREMLAGKLLRPRYRPQINCWHRQAATGKRVAIIGAGIAGACLAWSLSQKGYQVNVYGAAAQPADSASGNRQGGFYPQLHVDTNISSCFYASAFQYAKQYFTTLTQQGVQFAHDFCGVLQIAFNDNQRQRLEKLAKAQCWPKNLIDWLPDPTDTEQLAGVSLPYPCMHIPSGGWINPSQLVTSMFERLQTEQKVACFWQHRLTQCQYDQQWQLSFDHQPDQQADIIIFATGADSTQIAQLHKLPFRPVRGQVELVAETDALSKLQKVLCHKGYLTPSWQGSSALGSSYVKEDWSREVRQTETDFNISTLRKALTDCDWVNEIAQVNDARAATRCGTPDHLPIMGAVPDLSRQAEQYSEIQLRGENKINISPECFPNMFMLAGLGSRGLCTAPLLAEALACQISGQPLPLSQETLNALNPNRYLIRHLKKHSDT